MTRAERVTGNIEQASREINWLWVLSLLLVGFMLGTVANYLLFASFIRQDLAELQQQIQTMQSATPPIMLLPETPRKSKR